MTERREYPRAVIGLPLQVYASGSGRRLATGVTVDVSPAGFLAECRYEGPLTRGTPVAVHVGPPEVGLPGEDSLLAGRVHRLAEDGSQRCAVEILGTPPPFLLVPELVGKHGSIADIKTQLLDTADCDLNVLIQGESGTGKNVVASLIHLYSRRARFPLVCVNCPSIPDTLFESQLFGHEKGAFTDAKHSRPGLFRIADKGTLVLDEISAIPSSLQVTLLQAIELKRFMAVGSSETVQVDVRIVAITNENLPKRLREGAFRKDLFYRLNEVPLNLPTLRDRKSDIPLLADYFLRKYSAQFRKAYRPLATSETAMFQNYAWPGNVRELESTIKRGVLMGQFHPPDVSDKETPSTEAPGAGRGVGTRTRPTGSLRAQALEAETHAVSQALESSDYDRTKAAAELGISYRTLLRKMKKLRIGGNPPWSLSGSESAQGDVEANGMPLTDTREEAEKEAIARALVLAGNNKTRTAARLGISYRTLLRRIKQYHIQP